MYRQHTGNIPDKIAIIELLEEDGFFYVYIHYGNCSRKKLLRALKQKTEHIELAASDFEKLVHKKLKEKYQLLPNGASIACVGAQAVLFPALVKNKEAANTQEAVENKEEHRKLIV